MSSPLRAIKEAVKGRPALKQRALTAMRLFQALGWKLSPRPLVRYAAFLRDRRRFIRAGGRAPLLDLYPCLGDDTGSTGIDTHYFYQSIWAFRRIQEQQPGLHVDIASDVNFVGLLSTITTVVFVDIRPLFLSLPGYHGVGGSVTCLPFADASIASLSCMHVIEHVGLGRYGDPLDPLGPEKACREIARVIGPGGRAYISVPIGRPRVSFNGLRVFAPDEVPRLFAGLQLADMSIVDVPGRFVENLTPQSADLRETQGGLDFGLGLFCFRKNA